MKKLFALLITSTLIITLAACGNSGSDSKSENSKESSASVSSQAEEKTEDITEKPAENKPGSEYNVGDFTVYVPGGWDAVEVRATETDAVETNVINIFKGAEYDESAKQWKTLGKPHVYIFRYEGDEIDMVPDNKSLWENAEDIPDEKIGNFTWQGFSYNQFGEDGVNIWALNGDYGYRLSISFQNELSLDDADIKAIIESLK